MAAELVELYQQLGELVWGLFQERAKESLLLELIHQRAAGGLASCAFEVDVRIEELRASVAAVLTDIQQHPDIPEEPILKRLRAIATN
jgi:hypothetical protein